MCKSDKQGSLKETGFFKGGGTYPISCLETLKSPGLFSRARLPFSERVGSVVFCSPHEGKIFLVHGWTV